MNKTNKLKYHKIFLIIFLCLIPTSFFVSCKEMLPLPNINQPSDDIPTGKLVATPSNVTASHGQKRKITISWTPVSNIDCYYIYTSPTAYDSYTQIAECSGTATNIALNVPAGYSGYFKVAAVNKLGQISDLSLSTYGTSLATPIITSIEENNSDVTVSWYMENLSTKSYLSNVQFMINCYNPNGDLKETKIVSATDQTFSTFSNLAPGTKYLYEVEAYLLGDQNSTEKSLRIDAQTAVSLIPCVPDFSVSQGTSNDSIKISITLPPMAKILINAGTGGANTSTYEDRPLYFLIQRTESSKNDFNTVVNYFSFNAKTTPLSKDHADFSTYTQDNIIIYEDKISATNKIEPGVKYTYKVCAYIDNYFDKDNKRISITHDIKKANTKTGWIAAIPTLSSSGINYTHLSEDPSSLKNSASFTLFSTWNSLGKEDDYSYLILENHKKLKNDNNNLPDSIGTNKFILNPNNSSYYFNSISEINNFIITKDFAISQNQENEFFYDEEKNKLIRGYYNYSIYIIPNNIKKLYQNPNENFIQINDEKLLSLSDASTKLITNGQGLPTPKNFSIKDGFKNKVIISFKPEENSTYKLIRKTLDKNGLPDSSVNDKTIDLTDSITNYNQIQSFTDSDNIQSGMCYQYTLYASNENFDDVPSESINAFTLGTPNIQFENSSIDYSSVTVKWSTVMHNCEFNNFSEGQFINPEHDVRYCINYNGKTYNFLQSECTNENEEIVQIKNTDINNDYILTCTRGKEFVLTFNKGVSFFNYDSSKPTIDATDAGKETLITLTASNGCTSLDNSNVTSNSTNVCTLGPALTSITTTKAAQDVNKITITWNKIPGVENYVIRRTRPQILNSDFSESIDYYYINSNNKIFVNGDSIAENCARVYTNSSQYILEDLHCTAKDLTSSYQMNQEKIAFGLEYFYTVFPIKSQNDNPFEQDFNVTFTNLDNSQISQKGYTIGYGINILASKADYSDKIHITWQKPNAANGTIPALWYKSVNATKWTGPRYLNPTDTQTEVSLDATDRCDQIEFAITYESSNQIDWTDSYLAYQKNQKDADDEQFNVGYQFSLKDFRTNIPNQENESFTEQVNWTIWNQRNDTRKKRPGDGITEDCYIVQIKNLNCSNKWNTVATISQDGTITPVMQTWYDINIAPLSNGGLQLTALNNGQPFTTSKRLTRTSGQADVIKGIHNGLLKVQRDYKHYYRLIAKRKNSLGDEIETSIGDIDNTSSLDKFSTQPIFSFRKISDDEFVKGITLIVADAFYQCGISSGGKTSISGVNSNTFVLNHPSATRKFDWHTNNTNYKHKFVAGTPNNTNPLPSAWDICIASNQQGDSAQGSAVANIPWNAITVTHESNLPSYQGTILLKAGSDDSIGFFGNITIHYNLSIQYSHKTSISNDSDKIIVSTAHNDSSFVASHDDKYTADENSQMFFEWFPYTIGISHGDKITSKNDSEPIYNGTWWEVRD